MLHEVKVQDNPPLVGMVSHQGLSMETRITSMMEIHALIPTRIPNRGGGWTWKLF